MFGLFKKQDRRSASTKVWKSKEELYRGVGVEAMTLATTGGAAMIIAPFSDIREAVETFYQNNGVPFQRYPATGADNSTERIFVTDFTALAESMTSTFFELQVRQGPFKVLFVGRHPLKDREQQIVAKVPATVPVVLCASLEDRFFTKFGGEKLIELLEKLGLKPDEAIEHAFVDRAIENAQEKLAAGIKFEHKTPFEEEWFRKNAK